MILITNTNHHSKMLNVFINLLLLSMYYQHYKYEYTTRQLVISFLSNVISYKTKWKPVEKETASYIFLILFQWRKRKTKHKFIWKLLNIV